MLKNNTNLKLVNLLEVAKGINFKKCAKFVGDRSDKFQKAMS